MPWWVLLLGDAFNRLLWDNWKNQRAGGWQEILPKSPAPDKSPILPCPFSSIL